MVYHSVSGKSVHMLGNLCSKNFGLWQKYSVYEDYFVCEYSICEVLLYYEWYSSFLKYIKSKIRRETQLTPQTFEQ